MSSWNNARVWTLAVVLTMTGTALLAAGAPATPAAPGTILSGLASYYGPGFHGLETASGEIFNQYEMVAAHRSLPLGSVVRVTNLENRRRVTLRVIDRGPYGRNYRKGTIIDVSMLPGHCLLLASLNARDHRVANGFRQVLLTRVAGNCSGRDSKQHVTKRVQANPISSHVHVEEARDYGEQITLCVRNETAVLPRPALKPSNAKGSEETGSEVLACLNNFKVQK